MNSTRFVAVTCYISRGSNCCCPNYRVRTA